MNRFTNFLRRKGASVLLLGLALAVFLGACAVEPAPTVGGATPGSTPSPAPREKDAAGPSAVEPSPGTTRGANTPPVPGSPPVVEGGGGGSSGGGSAQTTLAEPDPSARYQWIGQVTVSRERAVEIARSCDTWTLSFRSPEAEKKALEIAGQRAVVWGVAVRGATPGGRPTVAVESIFGPRDAMPRIAIPEYPCQDQRVQQYSWAGVVVESNLEGRHLELKRDCDSWVLLTESTELNAKLEASIGKKLVVWGTVFTQPSINMRKTISVRAAFGVNDAAPAIYVPDYPCEGSVQPEPPRPHPVPPDQMDIMPGELTAAGKLVQEGQSWYLDTPSGRIRLEGNIPGPRAGGGQVDGARPTEPVASPIASEMLVTGKWYIKEGRLTIGVRYMRPLVVVPPEPPPPPPEVTPVPPPPGETFGVLYGRVQVGPLYPVEPCPRPTPDVYSSRVLLVQSESGSTGRIPLQPDGYFKWRLKPGTYIVTLSNCEWLGCKTSFPQKVTVKANETVMLEVRIDTGIR